MAKNKLTGDFVQDGVPDDIEDDLDLVTPVELASAELARDVLLDTPSTPPPSPGDRAATMRRLTTEVIERHWADLDASLVQLGLSGTGDVDGTATTAFKSVVRQVFADQRFNWGRLVTVYAFAAVLLEKCCPKSNSTEVGAQRRSKFAEQLCREIARVVAPWIADNGGWVSCCLIHSITSTHCYGDDC